MRVVALFRVSTEKQESQGSSLDSQQRQYRDLAAKSGWETVEEFRGCESATQAATERRVLQQVLRCIEEREPDAIYVHEQSRLTRGDELEVARLLRELRERRTKIIVGGVVRDLGSIDERFMVGIQSLVDRAESERIKERMQRGKRERAKQGKKSSGPAPYGYRNPPPGQDGRGRLVIVPDQAAVVRRLFALAAAGKGDRAVADALNAAGMASPRGGQWGKTSVRRALDNPAYIGTAASGVWKRIPGRQYFRMDLNDERAIVRENMHEPIIDRAAWDAVHGRVALPRTPKPRMLNGMLWVNGLPYSGDSSRHGTFYRGGRGLKGAPWLDAASTDERAWTAFALLATGPEFVQRLMEEAANPGEQAVLSQEIDYLEGQVAKQRKRLDHFVEMRADGEIDKPTFAAKTDEARKAIQAAESELKGLRAKAAVMDGTAAPRIAKAVQVLLAGWTRLDLDQKRTLLRTIVRRVDITAERTAAKQARGKGGGFAASGGPRWAVTNVSFRLALPPAQTPHGPTSPATGQTGGGGRLGPERRDGQLVTTS